MNGAKVEIWAMIVKRFFALFLIKPLYRHFTPMQIYCRVKLILGDQMTSPHRWFRQAGFDKLSQRIAAPELDRLSFLKPVETSNPQEATFS